MVWTPPTKPAPGISTPEQIIGKDIEMGGAAYRVQPGRLNTIGDPQIPYYDGFVKSKNAFEQTDISVDHNEVGVDGPLPPPDKAPQGTPKARATRSDAPDSGKANRRNVQNKKAPSGETSGEAPAPLFTQAVGRSTK